jgi:hypothetical protein
MTRLTLPYKNGALFALLKETEHLCRGRQEKVAKIVQCGEPRIEEAAGINSGGHFSLPSRSRNQPSLLWRHYVMKCY